jgi:hypothetical protein
MRDQEIKYILSFYSAYDRTRATSGQIRASSRGALHLLRWQRFGEKLCILIFNDKKMHLMISFNASTDKNDIILTAMRGSKATGHDMYVKPLLSLLHE